MWALHVHLTGPVFTCPHPEAQCTDRLRIHRQLPKPSLVDGRGSGTGFLPDEPTMGRDLEEYNEVLASLPPPQPLLTHAGLAAILIPWFCALNCYP